MSPFVELVEQQGQPHGLREAIEARFGDVICVLDCGADPHPAPRPGT